MTVLRCSWCEQRIAPNDQTVVLDEDGQEVVHASCAESLLRLPPSRRVKTW